MGGRAEVGVEVGKQALAGRGERHLAAEPRVSNGKLERDVVIAGDQKRRRWRVPFQCPARFDDAESVEGKAGQTNRASSRRDHDIFEIEVAHRFLAHLDTDARPAHEPRVALDGLDPGRVEQGAHSFDECVDRCAAPLVRRRISRRLSRAPQRGDAGAERAA